jgi:uncharacterized Zn-binding protein involved in type VI secretion
VAEPLPVAPQPAAKQGDLVTGSDVHVVMVPSPGGPVPTPTPMPFTGVLDGALAADIVCERRPIATQGSTATNTPPHAPAPGPFQRPPTNVATILTASTTVLAPGGGVARAGDTALTCNDPADLPNGTVVAVGTVFVG